VLIFTVTGPSSDLDANRRETVVEALAAAMRERYVSPDVGARSADRLGEALAAGEYNGLAQPRALAARLQEDLSSITHDKHLRVALERGPPPGGTSGIGRTSLDGGIGYVEVFGFPAPDAFKPALDKAMSRLAGSKALIIDVRRNRGGSPLSVAYLASYLFAPDGPVELSTVVRRIPGTTSFERARFRTSPTPVNFADVPVYILIGNSTFSGGEAFAYDMQALRRGVLVGETTGGGAHLPEPVQLGEGLVAFIPSARAQNPVTKTNWEGRGIQPDVPARASDALDVALETIQRTDA
jgi:hypothetical protein